MKGIIAALIFFTALEAYGEETTTETVYSQIILSAPDSVTHGENFFVRFQLADSLGHAIEGIKGCFIKVAANKKGMELPPGDIHVEKGQGGFIAKSTQWIGDGLYFTARDAGEIYSNGHDGAPKTLNGFAGLGYHIVWVSNRITVLPGKKSV